MSNNRILIGLIVSFALNIYLFFEEGGGKTVIAKRLLQLILLSIPLTVGLTVTYLRRNKLSSFTNVPAEPPASSNDPSASSNAQAQPEPPTLLLSKAENLYFPSQAWLKEQSKMKITLVRFKSETN